MSKLKIGIIGAGQIVRASHIGNYRSCENVEIVGICDVNETAAKVVAEKYGIPAFYGSHLEMLEKCKPNAVSVCVPNAFHSKIACDALRYGCHVYCEKPPAITVEEVEQMKELAEKNCCQLTFGFHFRHGQNVSFLKKKVEKGDMGDIYASRVQWIRRRGIPGWGNFTNKAMQGGGPLIDIGSHMLDLAVYFMDYPEIEYVCATAYDKIGKKGGTGLMGPWNGDKFTVEDGLFGFVRFKNGACLNIETAFALNIKEKDIRNVHIFGDKQGASLFPLEIYSQEENDLSNIEYPFIEGENLHEAAIHNFVKACRGEEKILVNVEQALYIQKMLCALYESAYSGKPVILS